MANFACSCTCIDALVISRGGPDLLRDICVLVEDVEDPCIKLHRINSVTADQTAKRSAIYRSN